MTSNQDPYAQSGVASKDSDVGFRGLISWARKSCELRSGVGRPTLGLGAFANVLAIADNVGLAISTDGVGTKLLVAQLMGRFDTIGIDCVAMNVNDVLCVGAEPIAVVDYIAVESLAGAPLEEIGRGLYEGARQAGCTIPGGEVAQVRDLLHTAPDGRGFDLVGTAVGIVALDKVIVGRQVEEGDVVFGLASTGLHSNGYSLARRVLLEQARLRLSDHLPGEDRPLGDVLLEPTRIYVQPVLEMLRSGVRVHALVHITGDGLFNLTRIDADFGYVLDNLPEPQPIFRAIQRHGALDIGEMYRVFNMGVGFVLVAPASDSDKVVRIAGQYGIAVHRLGVTRTDKQKRIVLNQFRLISDNGRFISQS